MINGVILVYFKNYSIKFYSKMLLQFLTIKLIISNKQNSTNLQQYVILSKSLFLLCDAQRHTVFSTVESISLNILCKIIALCLLRHLK